MVPSASATQVAGYPIVRLLVRGPRATLLLAQHDGEPRVLRVASESLDTTEIDREVEARARAPRDHAATLLDLGTSDAGAPVIVLEYLSGPRLDEFLNDRRAELSAGEAVTLIVPILETVAAAHDRGLTFGGVSTEGIRLRADGSPVITRFGSARAGAVVPTHLRGRDAQYRLDHDSALALATIIARHVTPPGGEELANVIDHGRSTGAELATIVGAVFDCAEPAPVRNPPRPALTTGGGAIQSVPRDRGRPGWGPPHARSPASVSAEASDGRQPPGVGRLAPLLRRVALPESLVESTMRLEERLVMLQAATRERRELRVRPRTIAVGAAGVASVVLALLLLGAGDAPDGAGRAPGGAGVDDRPGSSAALGEESAVPLVPLSHSRDPLDESALLTRRPDPEQWVEVAGALVVRWLECRARPAAPCERESTQEGSSAEAALRVPSDETARVLRAWRDGPRDLVVVERMGAAVFVDLVGPETTVASLLLMWSEATGWRLRDVLVEPRG
ncbi:MAG: hypothetical protein RJQ01_08345 [Microcella sp.]|uniref:hypothetical protein n=1 Tax=Microcella sp. TaxID=1913979 RepID=UPI0033155F7C